MTAPKKWLVDFLRKMSILFGTFPLHRYYVVEYIVTIVVKVWKEICFEKAFCSGKTFVAKSRWEHFSGDLSVFAFEAVCI